MPIISVFYFAVSGCVSAGGSFSFNKEEQSGVAEHRRTPAGATEATANSRRLSTMTSTHSDGDVMAENQPSADEKIGRDKY